MLYMVASIVSLTLQYVDGIYVLTNAMDHRRQKGWGYGLQPYGCSICPSQLAPSDLAPFLRHCHG